MGGIMSEENIKTKERLFFIRVQNLNIENGKPLFVGPFKKEDEATAIVEQARFNGQELMDGDEYINDETLNVSVIGGTLAKREGMKDPLSEMPQIEKWQTYFPGGDIYKSNRGRPKGKKEEDEEMQESQQVVRKSTPVSVTSSSPTKVATQPANGTKTKTGQLRHPVTTKKEYIIVSNRMGIINWLGKLGYRGEVISYVTHPDQVRGKIVIGVVPPWFVCYAEKYAIPNIPGLNTEQNRDITVEQIEAAGGKLDWYFTRKIDE
jgi:hypothetical protein